MGVQLLVLLGCTITGGVIHATIVRPVLRVLGVI